MPNPSEGRVRVMFGSGAEVEVGRRKILGGTAQPGKRTRMVDKARGLASSKTAERNLHLNMDDNDERSC